jgi:hypothetical protein
MMPASRLTRRRTGSYTSNMRGVSAGSVVLLLLATTSAADQLAVSRLSGGGSGAHDCLTGLQVVGTNLREKARTVVCHDGELACDRDGLVNGHCTFWTAACFDRDGTCGDVASATIESGDDTELVTLARTLELVAMPVTADTCGAVTSLTVALGTRPNGSARKGRKTLAWHATAMDGATDDDAVTFFCKPPQKDKRRGGISFASIEKRIFAKNCAFSGCHGTSNPQAGLTLVGDHVYESLVDKVATASAAQFAGKKLVVPGAPETSFLMDKLEGKLGPGEGDPMPFGRRPLRDADVEVIRKWILAGAPKERVISGGITGELDQQPRIPAPVAPAGGFQAHMAPFMLGDRPETEGCQMVRLGNTEEIDVGQWELFMHEGSHHFILRASRCLDANQNGISDCDEPDFDSKFPTGFAPCEQFGYGWAFLVGAQTPHYLVDYQTAETGVAVHLRKNQPLLLNSHYTNPFADTMAEVWVNVTPVDHALVQHPARILFEELANVFIKVPPGTESDAATYLSCAFYADPKTGAFDPLCDIAGEPTPTADRFAFLGMVSHMHKRSGKFVSDLAGLDGARIPRSDDMTDAADGSQHLYVSTDYDDPINRAFWPPIIVEKGQKLTYTCFHENGVRSPVRLGCEETAGVPPGKSILEAFAGGGDPYKGASKWCRTDADCAGFGTGRCVPANLVFGELADDDMCILPGLFYDCPASGPCVSGGG